MGISVFTDIQDLSTCLLKPPRSAFGQICSFTASQKSPCLEPHPSTKTHRLWLWIWQGKPIVPHFPWTFLIRLFSSWACFHPWKAQGFQMACLLFHFTQGTSWQSPRFLRLFFFPSSSSDKMEGIYTGCCHRGHAFIPCWLCYWLMLFGGKRLRQRAGYMSS